MLTLQIVLLLAKLASAAHLEYAREVSLPLGQLRHKAKPLHYVCHKCAGTIIFLDNDFEVFIDPDGDNWMYYELEVNALAQIWDLLLIKPYRNGGPPVMNWETLPPALPTATSWEPMQASVAVNGSLNSQEGSVGWTVELALPWSLLRQAAGSQQVPPKAGDQWRINFSRDLQWLDGPVAPEWCAVWMLGRPAGPGAASSCESPGAAFAPDMAWPARALLMDVYHLQTICWQANKRFCNSLQEMNITDVDDGLAARTRIETTSASFVATCSVALPDGGGIMVMVDQLSRLTQYRFNSEATPDDPGADYDPFTGTSHFTNHISNAKL
eukprot:gene7907-8103_t